MKEPGTGLRIFNGNMLNLIFLAGIFLFTLSYKKPIPGTLPPVQQTSAGIDLSKYTFFGQDDFNGAALNTSIWDYRQLNMKRNNGVSFDSLVSSNVIVSNGILSLVSDHVRGNIFSASMISTEQHPDYWLKYGYFEIRAQLLSFYGSACAFWLQSPTVAVENNNPSINGVEVDILEYGKVGGAETLFQSLVWNGYGASRKSITATVRIPGIASGFHTFALEWTPREYIIYVDGTETARSDSAVSHRPEFIILSNGTGGFGGNPLNPGTTFPDQFKVDYIKVYKRKPEVTLYGLCDFYGWTSAGLGPGAYTKDQLAALQVVNNDVSSIEVPAGWAVTLYDGDNFTGDSITVTSDSRCFSPFDNKASSLRIRDH